MGPGRFFCEVIPESINWERLGEVAFIYSQLWTVSHPSLVDADQPLIEREETHFGMCANTI